MGVPASRGLAIIHGDVDHGIGRLPRRGTDRVCQRPAHQRNASIECRFEVLGARELHAPVTKHDVRICAVLGVRRCKTVRFQLGDGESERLVGLLLPRHRLVLVLLHLCLGRPITLLPLRLRLPFTLLPLRLRRLLALLPFTFALLPRLLVLLRLLLHLHFATSRLGDTPARQHGAPAGLDVPCSPEPRLQVGTRALFLLLFVLLRPELFLRALRRIRQAQLLRARAQLPLHHCRRFARAELWRARRANGSADASALQSPASHRCFIYFVLTVVVGRCCCCSWFGGARRSNSGDSHLLCRIGCLFQKGRATCVCYCQTEARRCSCQATDNVVPPVGLRRCRALPSLF